MSYGVSNIAKSIGHTRNTIHADGSGRMNHHPEYQNFNHQWHGTPRSQLGQGAFNDPRWNWAQVSTPESTSAWSWECRRFWQKYCALGAVRGQDCRVHQSSGKSSYVDLTLSNLTSRTYPVTYTTEAGSGDFKLLARIDVLKDVHLLTYYSLPMPRYVIFEQVSGFNGILQPKDGEAYNFGIICFSEYTTRNIHPVYGQIDFGDPRNVTAKATNQRTGGVKTSEPISSGYFSLDRNHVDYLNNKTAPWVDNNDVVSLVAQGSSGKVNSTETIVNHTADR
jgi:hypothetical protein